MRAKRSLGQNFLIDPNLQRKIVAAVEPEPDDVVVEIGAGTGALTRHLAGQVARLIAIELDDRLAASLERGLGRGDGVEIVHGDALDIDLARLAAGRYKVVGNIPYNITTPLLFHVLDQEPRPERIVVMLQQEVAERIVADPGGKTYGALSIGVRALADVELLFRVGRNAFRPVPDIDSAVLGITPRPDAPGPEEAGDLRALTRAAFGRRRKQLQKTLRTAPGYALGMVEVQTLEAETGIRLVARPETLSPDQFIDLAATLRTRGYPRRGP